MPIIKIVQLPENSWVLEVDDRRSARVAYDQVIFFEGYVAHTCYHGDEQVFTVGQRVDHEAIDHSTGE